MSDDRGFLERLSIIAGQSTYREPVGGYGSRVHHIPSAHCLLVTLVGARPRPGHPGVEMVMTLLTGVDDRRSDVIAWLEDELSRFDARLVAKCRDDLPMAMEIAYRSATGRRVVFDGLSADVQKAIKAAAYLLESAMDETIARCEDNEAHA